MQLTRLSDNLFLWLQHNLKVREITLKEKDIMRLQNKTVKKSIHIQVPELSELHRPISEKVLQLLADSTIH